VDARTLRGGGDGGWTRRHGVEPGTAEGAGAALLPMARSWGRRLRGRGEEDRLGRRRKTGCCGAERGAHPPPHQEGRREREEGEGEIEVRGRRGRAAVEEEEGGRRRRTPVAPVAVVASG